MIVPAFEQTPIRPLLSFAAELRFGSQITTIGEGEKRESLTAVYAGVYDWCPLPQVSFEESFVLEIPFSRL